MSSIIGINDQNEHFVKNSSPTVAKKTIETAMEEIKTVVLYKNQFKQRVW